MRNEGIQLRIGDLLYAFHKRWKTVLALTVVGLLLGLLLSGMNYVQGNLLNYEIQGSVAISTLTEGRYLNNGETSSMNDFTLAENMVDAVRYLLRSDRTLNEVINRLELLGVKASQIRDSLTISQFNATQILDVTLSWNTAEEGLSIWNTAVDVMNQLMPQTLRVGSLAVVNEPAVQSRSSGSSGLMTAALLTFAGFACGVGYILLELVMHPTLTNAKDAEGAFGLEILGSIPRDNRSFRKQGTLPRENTINTEAAQHYAAAAYILRNRLGTKEEHHCFYITSTADQEGKTTVAANLALQLAEMGHRTLLVDFDARNPGVGAMFLPKVDYSATLNALYRGDANEGEAITRINGFLDILPMVLEHNPIPMDGAVVDLIRSLTQKYEYVILDASPVGEVSDTLSLNQVADTALFVIGYDMATITGIENALEKLDKSGIRVLGCVVNAVQPERRKPVSRVPSGQGRRDRGARPEPEERPDGRRE